MKEGCFAARCFLSARNRTSSLSLTASCLLALCLSAVTLLSPGLAQAQVDEAYSHSYGHPAENRPDETLDLNFDAELAVEDRFNLPQTTPTQPARPGLDLKDTHTPLRNKASVTRGLASETSAQNTKTWPAASQPIIKQQAQTKALPQVSVTHGPASDSPISLLNGTAPNIQNPQAAQHQSAEHQPEELDLHLAEVAEVPAPQNPQAAQNAQAAQSSQAAQNQQAMQNNAQADKLQNLKAQQDELQMQLDDAKQQNQHRAQYVQVLEKDLKKAKAQLQQLQIELQQAQNETQRYVKATKKLNQKIKTVNQKIANTTRGIAQTYEQQNNMKSELKKNLKEYKAKQQSLRP